MYLEYIWYYMEPNGLKKNPDFIIDQLWWKTHNDISLDRFYVDRELLDTYDSCNHS